MKENHFPENDGFLEDDGLFEEELPEDLAPVDPESLMDGFPDDDFGPEEFSEEPAGEAFPADEYPEDGFTGEEYPDAGDFGDVFPEDGYAGGEAEGETFDNHLSPEEDELFHEALVSPETGEELTAADHAMYSAGLTHPEDADFFLGNPEDSADEAERQDCDTGDSEPEAEEGAVTPTAPVRSRRERPTRKGRPKRRKGSGLFSLPQLAAAAIWLLIILAIGVSLGRMIWVCAADVLAFGREEKLVTVSITTDDTMDTIADKLRDAGLIRYPELFKLYADLSHAEQKITTGTFTLNTIYDYHALVNQMSPRAGNRAVVEDVLIPEGFTCRQIFALLEEKGVCKAADLEAWAADGELKDYWFLEDVERGSKYCLEGYLFPDTYDFYENSTPKQALEKMLDGFNYRFTEELQSQLPALNERLSQMMRDNGSSEEFIAANQFGLHELLTVASLIEKETSGNEESPKIASVIYNRLFSWGDTPRYLNIDASVIYALEGKTNLTVEDMSVDSPYNTYTHTGLTPGPIANPGIASLTAALNPADTSYYYYVLDPEAGEHIFSKTLEEHEKNVAAVREKANG